MDADQHVVLSGGPQCSALGLAFVESVPGLERIKIQMTFKMVKGRMTESKECRNQGRIESGAPEGRECAAQPPGGGVEGAAAAQRSTARAAFEGASPHYSPASHSGSLLLPPLRAAPWLATWRRWTCRRGAGPQVHPRGPSAGQYPGGDRRGVPPPSCGRSSGGPQTPFPGLLSSLRLLELAPLLRGSEAGWRGKSAPGHQVETLFGRAPAWSLETWRRWGFAAGRDAWPRAPLLKAYADQPGSQPPEPPKRPRDSVCLLSDPGPRAPGSWWKSKREGLNGGGPLGADLTSAEAVPQSRNACIELFRLLQTPRTVESFEGAGMGGQPYPFPQVRKPEERSGVSRLTVR